MGKTLKPLIIGIIIGVVGLYAYQNPDVRSQVSEFVGRMLNSVSDAPAPAPTTPPIAALPAPTATPTQVAPVQVSPIPTATPLPSPTNIPKSEPSPTVTATRVPIPSPTPASYSINVISVETVADGQVDFLLEVRNESGMAREETAQVKMSVDGGAPELVNIIGSLSPGESTSFAFTRAFTPGPHTVTFTVGDSHTTVNVDIENVSTPTHTSTITPTPQPTVTAIPSPMRTPTPMPTNIPVPTNTPFATNTPPPPTSTPTPTYNAALSPDLRHIDEKNYMLELVNTERAKAGLNPVILGDNIAAQLHAEAALENCFTGHWGVDGLKPYMRYSLAGGYQSNSENGLGKRYCIEHGDGFRSISGIKEEIRDAIEGWMGSSGHRRNILGKWHKKVNIGLAWDKYNISFYQHFEGDYVGYEQLPAIRDEILSLSGTTKNGALFTGSPAVQIYYDPPPHSLTRGQLSKTYCYDSGSQIGALRRPLTGNEYYSEHRFTSISERCDDPYDFPADTPAPKPPRGFFPAIETPRLPPLPVILDLPWITALELGSNGEEFSIRADLSNLISEYGDGVYSVIVWGKIGGENAIISRYSIFHGVTPSDTYGQ